jgi:hypothetical protein
LIILADILGFIYLNPKMKHVVLQSFHTFVEVKFSSKIKVIRSDNGTEFFLPSFYISKGIMHQTSCVATPKQNGIVEKTSIHQYILKFQSCLPDCLWWFCVQHAIYLINLSPTPLLQNSTSSECLFHHPPDYSSLRVFGCLAYANTLSRNWSKFDPCNIKYVFLRYPAHSKGFVPQNLRAKDIFISSNVQFHETVFPLSTTSVPTKTTSLPVPFSSDPSFW